MKRRNRPTVEELKNLFWWLVDTGYERWPLSCIICGVKMHPNLKQVEKHDTGKVHRNGLLTYGNFEKLKRYVAAEKLMLATELGLHVKSVFFRFTKTSISSSLKEAVMKSSFWCVSFQSHEGIVIEMTLVGNGICICFHRSLFRAAPIRHPTRNKQVFFSVVRLPK